MTKKDMLLRFLNKSKRYFVLAIFFTLSSTLADMIRPKIIEYTVDGIITSQGVTLPEYVNDILNTFGGITYIKSHLYIIAAAIMISSLIAVILNYFYSMSCVKGSEIFVKNMRDQLFDHIEHLPLSWHSSHATGDIIQRCTNDVEEIKTFVSDQFVNLVTTIVTIVFALLFMFKINFKLSLASSLCIPVIVFCSFRFHEKIGESFMKCDVNEGILSNIAQENFTGVRVVRAFGKEKSEKDKFAKQNKIVTKYWIDLGKNFATYFFLTDTITGAIMLIILAYGSYLCVQGEFSVGGILAMISYLAMLIRPVRTLGRTLSELSKTDVSLTRLLDIMSAEVEKDQNTLHPDMHQDIIFDHVTFGYQGHEELLHNISFKIPAGTTLGILGSTASGKSTLAHLLTRLYPLEKGKIYIGDTDLQDIEASWVRKNIGFVLQEPFLFSRSIKDNLSITQEDMSEEEIRNAANIACFEKTADHFTNGFDTFVGERGVTLSGGQKQRAAIARTLTLNTPILIFDDSLSAVDSETDTMIRENLKKYMSNVTTILISHRITTLMAADSIIVLDEGKIIDSGTHEQLIGHEGLYKKIYDIQQGGKDEQYE